MEILRDKGRPNYKAYYSKISSVERVGERGVRFNLAGANDRELPLIIGLMPIFPKHAIDPATFDKSTLKPPIGSGPYLVSEVSAPNYIVYKRNPDYWGKDLPIHRGLFNYDEVRVEYYRDANTMFEAFKKGLYDVNPEGDPAQWNTAYDFPAVKDGKVVKETFKTGTPKGMSGFVFNTRRPVFADKRVRKALATLFDFDWVNKNLYYGAFVRAAGYFNDSELSAIGRPASDKEKALLAPFPGVVDKDVMDGTYKPVSAGGAGWRARGPARGAARAAGRRLCAQGQPARQHQDRQAARLRDHGGQQGGREAGARLSAHARPASASRSSVRNVEDAQFQPRLQQFDYDMVRRSWGASLSPGNEQLGRWSSEAADRPSSFNYAGAKQPAIDAMIAAMLAARTREDFVAAVRALDRVLISGYYVVPLFYLPDQWIARWNTIEHPETTALTG